MSQIESAIEYFVPDKLRNSGADAVHRAKLIVVFTFALVFWGSIYALIYYYLLNSPQGAMAMGVSLVLGPQVPFVLRRTGSCAIAGNYLLLILLWAIASCAYVSGGHNAPSVYWVPVISMLAILLKGKYSQPA